ncbi:serine hydrolase domain-containing protein [Cellulosilyticum ruminicola]|uniref:serine hydrolase domain-containing protein n=1 Tax=Cellulosilyticum ruminicola TaxID=425254 RepID=UPI0006D04548|nr:serine hydrolase [Cellulosilyticum ruminicola]
MQHNELHDLVLKTQPNICQISAIKNNYLVYSDSWNNAVTTDNFHIASATKSIISLLIGIAMDQKLIQNVDQKVLDFFPNYTIKRSEKTISQVTLKHLLTMTAPYKYKSEPWTKVCTSNDWTKATLDLLGGRAGITGKFKYATLGIQILSAIITKASHMTTLEFANKFLFAPLGIKPCTAFTVQNKEEHIQFVTDKSPKANSWFCDPQGISAAGFGLSLSAEDMVKIGALCLNQGTYHSKQIISSNWIHQMTTPYIHCNERFNHMHYGYLWWIINPEKSIYAAIGDSGNVIYVNSTTHTAIAITATFKPAVLDRIQFIEEHIEPFLEIL